MSKKRIIMDEYDKSHSIYQTFAKDVESLLNRIISAEGIVCNAITSRLKERESLSKKIDLKNGKYSCLADLTDIAGIRIITYYSGDVDKIAEIVEKEFCVDRENSIDKRMALEPDRFGYCSVHYVVSMSEERLRLKEYKAYDNLKCEIQIRSVLQHAWAEIEHDLGYKSEIAVPTEIRRNFSRLAGLLEIADKEFLEIREKLSDYASEVGEKIKKDEMYNKELDSVIIQTLCSSNDDIKEINAQIAAFFKAKIDDKSGDFEYFEHRIESLHWLNVYTFGELLHLIQKNKAKAIEIARVQASRSGNEYETLNMAISIFYICYAEVISRFDDVSKIEDYLNHSNIGEESERHEFAKELLELSNI
ncbi:MAG: hypothetical protein IJ435_03350 [Clostridia bacterium]|nr:hypothetical protein [Clostridia bacterium]